MQAFMYWRMPLVTTSVHLSSNFSLATRTQNTSIPGPCVQSWPAIDTIFADINQIFPQVRQWTHTPCFFWLKSQKLCTVPIPLFAYMMAMRMVVGLIGFQLLALITHTCHRNRLFLRLLSLYACIKNGLIFRYVMIYFPCHTFQTLPDSQVITLQNRWKMISPDRHQLLPALFYKVHLFCLLTKGWLWHSICLVKYGTWPPPWIKSGCTMI
jgi:hypothetical protein